MKLQPGDLFQILEYSDHCIVLRVVDATKFNENNGHGVLMWDMRRKEVRKVFLKYLWNESATEKYLKSGFIKPLLPEIVYFGEWVVDYGSKAPPNKFGYLDIRKMND